jgi:hypothetical protein
MTDAAQGAFLPNANRVDRLSMSICVFEHLEAKFLARRREYLKIVGCQRRVPPGRKCGSFEGGALSKQTLVAIASV